MDPVAPAGCGSLAGAVATSDEDVGTGVVVGVDMGVEADLVVRSSASSSSLSSIMSSSSTDPELCLSLTSPLVVLGVVAELLESAPASESLASPLATATSILLELLLLEELVLWADCLGSSLCSGEALLVAPSEDLKNGMEMLIFCYNEKPLDKLNL